MEKPRAIVPESRIARHIAFIRGHKVMLDQDLAGLYGVSTKRLNEQVRRNSERFPSDFMFQLTSEQGVAMLSGVLNSRRAVRVNVEIMRTFVRSRQILSSHVELGRKLEELKKKYDSQFRVVFDAIRELMSVETGERRPVGFRPSRNQGEARSTGIRV